MLSESVEAEIISRLSKLQDLNKVILFGSQARGTADRHSDVDLILLLNYFDDQLKVTHIARELLDEIEQAFDIIVMTPEEYDEDSSFPGSVSRYASKEGRILYAA
jgi:predicted nucleotidyltransferase